jgi:hypothetical protein
MASIWRRCALVSGSGQISGRRSAAAVAIFCSSSFSCRSRAFGSRLMR